MVLIQSCSNIVHFKFCDLVSEYGIKGKFSIVLNSGGLGNILSESAQYSHEDAKVWVDTVQERLAGRFDFCPEMITHSHAMNLKDGTFLTLNK